MNLIHNESPPAAAAHPSATHPSAAWLGRLPTRFAALLLAALLLAALSPDAEARRMGGGRSMGRQSSQVTQREAAPPAAPQQAGQQASRQPGSQAAQNSQGSAQGAAAAAARKPAWGGILGGLAAGLGLAWLANSLGLGQGFANLMLILLLGLGALAVFNLLRRQRSPAPAPGGLAYQGAGSAAHPVTPPQYNPAKIGNDASARPWEGLAAQGGGSASSGTLIGSALSGPQTWGIPDGFDIAGFTESAKRNFIHLQAAWDRADIPALRAMMTDGMLAEVQTQLAERQASGQPSQTDVVMLQAQLLGIEELPDVYMASVEFSGVLQEDGAGPAPFREVWNMTKPRQGPGGWLVAGLQAMQ